MIDQRLYQALSKRLFGEAGLATYAALDGCMIDQLPQKLEVAKLDHACLFSGQLDPLLEAAAPWLVQLKPGNAFSESVLREGWNAHWGIVLQTGTGVDLGALRQHLRRQLRVAAPGGQNLFFRFYDPRAFRAVVPHLNDEQRKEFLGPIRKAWIEGEDPASVLLFQPGQAATGQSHPLAVAA